MILSIMAQALKQTNREKFGATHRNWLQLYVMNHANNYDLLPEWMQRKTERTLFCKYNYLETSAAILPMHEGSERRKSEISQVALGKRTEIATFLLEFKSLGYSFMRIGITEPIFTQH